MTVGTLISPVPAALSREKNIIDVNKEVFAFAQTPKSARFVGYPLLALAGGFGIMQAAKMFKSIRIEKISTPEGSKINMDIIFFLVILKKLFVSGICNISAN